MENYLDDAYRVDGDNGADSVETINTSSLDAVDEVRGVNDDQRTESAWREALNQLGSAHKPSDERLRDIFRPQPDKPLRYYVNLRESRLRDRLVLDLMVQGPDGRDIPVELQDGDTKGLSEADADIIRLLFGANGETRARGHHARDLGLGRCSVRPSMYRMLLPQVARTGRFYADLGLSTVEAVGPLGFQAQPALSVRLVIDRLAKSGSDFFRLWGVLASDSVRVDFESPRILLSDGLALVGQTLYLVPPDEHLDWALRLRRHGPVEFPDISKDQFIQELSGLPDLPDVELPPELHWSRMEVLPRPKILFYADKPSKDEQGEEDKGPPPFLKAKVIFEYGGLQVAAGSRESAIVDEVGRRWFRRDLASERAHLERLKAVELQPDGSSNVQVERRKLSDVIKNLISVEWSVESDGVLVRSQSRLRARVQSGIDWFDLEAVVDFGGGATAALPKLLRAAAAGRDTVRLSDGTKGLIPVWIKKYSAVARLGKSSGDRLRFLPSQAGVIDVLLAGHDETSFDVEFEALRGQLESAKTLGGVEEPHGFKGKLRDYQREGVAWMQFLSRHGYGGCLADDMGLGKTVQVLCLLQGRHPPGEEQRPSLVIVPKSLVHNWVDEAAKFTELKVINYTGAKRGGQAFSDANIIVTTYGTLRQEILKFTDQRWTTVILDEAQAIKNPTSQAAKACRLLRSDLRLAISGTPIENGLEELWSLFEFLNPGMLGGLGAFADSGREDNEEWLGALSRALKPFMLRRTKDEVLKELPGKTEQLWSIPLGDEERAQYDELVKYYTRALKGVLNGEDRSAGAKVHVLEALLRLRQAACHPGLIDPAKIDSPSAKIDALFEKLEEITRRGYKALIFSQFTTLLEVVRRRLQRNDMQYAYLDGATADRQKTVSQFTDNEDCGIFLISLKAGGCGLNLTQSNYVFILDPWWNPAIEAQAVDRAYRMGQKNRVFAYKMIAENTVEQKIVGLQQEKRRLADAVVNTTGGPMADLDAQDLALLLGSSDAQDTK